MNLFFGNRIRIITSLLLIFYIGFIIYTFVNRKSIKSWGKLIAFILIVGLVICCFAATRDGLDKTIQNTIDGSTKPGVFKLVSIPTIVGSILALIIIVIGLVSIVFKKQNAKEVVYFVLSNIIFMKIIFIEISRIVINIG